jgi:hypothetical protein
VRLRESLVVVLLAAGSAGAQRPARGEPAAPTGGALPRLESGAGPRADPRRGAGGWSPWADAGWGAGEWWPGAGAYGSGWYGPSGRDAGGGPPRRRVRPLVIVVGGPILAAPPPAAPAARGRPAAAGGADDQAEESDDAGDVPCDAPGADRCVDAVRRVGRTKVIEVGAARTPGAARDSAARRRPPR